MKFNINQYVRVRLTDAGRAAHRKWWDDLFQSPQLKSKYSPPKEDAEGWSRWQLHILMHELGPALCPGFPVPFETEIIIEES